MENLKQTSGPRIVSPYVETSSSKAGRFITLSVFVHAAMIATVSLMDFTPLEISKSHDVIEIEMAGDTDSSTSGEGLPDFDQMIPAESLAGESGTPAAAAPTTPANPTATSAPTAVTTPPATSAPVANVSTAPPTPENETAQTAETKVTPEKTQPVDTTQALETSETGEAPVSELDANELQEDTERIDLAQQQSLAAAAAKAEAKLTAEAEQAEIQAAAEARRQKDAEVLAAAKAKEIAMMAARDARAKERAQAEERARAAQATAAAKADAEAKAAADAKTASASQSAAASNGSGTTSGTGPDTESEGTGDSNAGSGNGEGTKQVAGIPGGVRSLGQLRQKPGNRFPPYEPRERLLRQEGTVVYYAYVNKDGTLSEFKLSKSTGYKNLDEKTLAALRNWKFYPGQEGWVEMPFQWSLKGEAQEAGGLLR